MKRTLVAACALALAITATASQLNVVDAKSGKKIGDATYSLTKASGKVTVKITMTMAQENAKVNMSMTFVHTSAGDPVSQLMKVTATAQGNTFTSEVDTKFAGRKATMTVTAMGNKQTKTATAAGPVTDKTVVWIAGSLPAVGTKTTVYEFDPQAGVFEKATNTYHGIRDVKTASNKTVKAHVITSTKGSETTKIYFTSSGDLVKLESTGMTLVQK